MKALALSGLAILALTTPVQALAQEQNSRFTRRATQRDAGKVFELWASCVGDLDAKWARAVLDTVPTTDLEEKAFDRRAGEADRCLQDSRLVMDGKQLTFSMESGRGEIARHLARKQLRAGGQPRPGAATAWLHENLSALPEGTRFNKSLLVGHDLAACLADEYWAEARATVTADSPAAEKAAFAALAPRFGSCMTEGAKLTLNVPILRLLLSEAVYHALTYTPRPAVPASAAAGGAGAKN